MRGLFSGYLQSPTLFFFYTLFFAPPPLSEHLEQEIYGQAFQIFKTYHEFFVKCVTKGFAHSIIHQRKGSHEKLKKNYTTVMSCTFHKHIHSLKIFLVVIKRKKERQRKAVNIHNKCCKNIAQVVLPIMA